MKQDKLISMVDFVLSQNRDDDAQYRMINYANFLSQPLTIGMFVPCLDGVVLEEPICYGVGDEQYFGSRMDEYQQAKERVLFDLPNLETDMDVLKNLIMGNTIELLVDESTTLTETALKQIGLNN